MEHVDALLSEHSRLKAEVVMLRELGAGWQERAAAAEAEVERLRKALEWYAGDGSTYDGIDVGQRARAALTDGETHGER